MTEGKEALFACVGKGDTVLVHFSKGKPQLLKIAEGIIGRLPKCEVRSSMKEANLIFHYVVDKSGYSFVVAATEESGKRLPNQLLDDIKTKFTQRFGTDPSKATPSACAQFGDVLKERSKEVFAGDRVTQVQADVAGVRDQMLD
eukprot:370176_1